MGKMQRLTKDNESKRRRGNLYALEICFLVFVGIIVLAAFFEATTYAIVSSRTPFVIMVPLFILIVVHALRLWAVRHEFSPSQRITDAFAGRTPGFNKVMGISGILIALIFAIWVFGHYVGIFLLCLVLMRLAGERLMLSLIVAAGTTIFVFGVFEVLFDIRLYRGLIIRYFLGFRDFDFLRDIE